MVYDISQVLTEQEKFIRERGLDARRIFDKLYPLGKSQEIEKRERAVQRFIEYTIPLIPMFLRPKAQEKYRRKEVSITEIIKTYQGNGVGEIKKGIWTQAVKQTISEIDSLLINLNRSKITLEGAVDEVILKKPGMIQKIARETRIIFGKIGDHWHSGKKKGEK